MLHNNDIIHGDLTTSNMIFNNGKLFFIDFGLSIISKKIEDKAVDIHLFRQNFESTHNELFKEGFDIFLKNYYKNVENSQEIKNRFEEVEKRGRNKH
ncbi:Kae1-associated serine/threonine protein kinase [bacterium]|nr:Kae1-associated serine/threonine protein kinase [bacterium]